MFDPRPQPSVFIGYSQKQNAYKLYCLKTRKVYTFRDVRLHENLFPFHFSKDTSQTLRNFFLP